MPKTILSHYELTKDTLAILPANFIDYYSTVWERDQQIYVKKTPIQLIKEACMEGGAEYDGRRSAVVHKTGVCNKVPMPINPLENIYAFPTHSPKQHECMWIFYHHIKSIKPDPQNTNQSMITFNNYKELLLNISIHTLERQIHRTSYCILRFSHHSFSDRSSLFYSSLNENIHPFGGPL